MDRNKSRPKYVKVKAGARCLVCGIDKPLDGAHIIPDRLLRPYPIINKKKFRDYDGVNVFNLCSNHHRAYDHDMLTIEEFELLRPHINSALNQLNAHIVALLGARHELPKSFFISYQSFITSTEQYGRN